MRLIRIIMVGGLVGCDQRCKLLTRFFHFDAHTPGIAARACGDDENEIAHAGKLNSAGVRFDDDVLRFAMHGLQGEIGDGAEDSC